MQALEAKAKPRADPKCSDRGQEIFDGLESKAPQHSQKPDPSEEFGVCSLANCEKDALKEHSRGLRETGRVRFSERSRALQRVTRHDGSSVGFGRTRDEDLRTALADWIGTELIKELSAGLQDLADAKRWRSSTSPRPRGPLLSAPENRKAKNLLALGFWRTREDSNFRPSVP